MLLSIFFCFLTYIFGIATSIYIYRSYIAPKSRNDIDTPANVIIIDHSEKAQSAVGGLFDNEEKQFSLVTVSRILQKLGKLKETDEIHIAITTPGGMSSAVTALFLALIGHKGRITVYIPHYCFSGGTVLALAADEIVMSRHAILGPVDPQLIIQKQQKVYAASDIISICEDTISATDVDFDNRIHYMESNKIVNRVRDMLYRLVDSGKYTKEEMDVIYSELASGKKYTHDTTFTSQELIKMGLKIRVVDDFPDVIQKYIR